MANVRVTKKDMFNEILANYELSEAHKEFIEKQLPELFRQMQLLGLGIEDVVGTYQHLNR